jgi:hypothetical protein
MALSVLFVTTGILQIKHFHAMAQAASGDGATVEG